MNQRRWKHHHHECIVNISNGVVHSCSNRISNENDSNQNHIKSNGEFFEDVVRFSLESENVNSPDWKKLSSRPKNSLYIFARERLCCYQRIEKNCKFSFFWWLMRIVFSIALIIFWSAFIDKDRRNIYTVDDMKKYIEAEPCNFEDLQASFGKLDSFQQQREQCNNMPPKNNSCCWNLKDVIVRVPVEAILNRDSMTKLGGGKKGGVYKAIIGLPQKNAHDEDDTSKKTKTCSIAVKTDHCTRLSRIEILIMSLLKFMGSPNAFDDVESSSVSCASSNARLFDLHSFMASEYAGSLIYYSQILYEQDEAHRRVEGLEEGTSTIAKKDLIIPGLLPTYAVVTSDIPLRNVFDVPRMFWKGQPIWHDLKNYGNIIGVLIPIHAFDPLTTYNRHPQNLTRALEFKHSIYEISSNITSWVNTFLQAAKGLEYVNSHLGLAYQDIKEKNVGIIYDEGMTIAGSLIYDHSYVGVSNHSNHLCNDIRCRFCRESIFPHAYRPSDFFVEQSMKNSPKKRYLYDNLQSDYYHFRLILIDILDKCPDLMNNVPCLQLRSKLRNATNIGELVRILQVSQPSATT